MSFRPAKTPSLVFFLLALVFFGPVLFPAEGWALGSHDMRGLFYPWLEQLRLAVTAGHMPWWDPTRFAGYPFLSNPQVAAFYPPTWLAVVLPTRIGISFYYLVHLWLAGWGMFLLAREWIWTGERHKVQGKRNKPPELVKGVGITSILPAFAAGITFMFAGFFTARLLAGHMGLIAVHSWVPWIVWATGRSMRRPRWPLAVGAGFFLALAILAGHTTSLLYVGLIWGAFGLFWRFKCGLTWWVWGRQLTIAAGFALLLAAVQLVPLAEISLLAARTAETTFEFATDFSFPPSHLITLLVPEFFGEPTRAGYWSVPNFEELTAYFGVVALLGIALALSQPRRSTWFLLGLALIGLLLALGRYGFLYRLAYDWLPPFRLARAPGRAMFVVVFCASLLLADGLSRLSTITWRWRWVAAGIALAGLIALATTGAVFAAQHPSDTSGRLWHQLGGWAWAAGLLLVGTLVLSKLARDKKGPSWGWALAILGLIVVDLWGFGYKLRQLEPMTPDGYWFEARDLLGSDFDGRILPWGVSIFAQNGAGQVGLDSLFGYNALEVGAYTALVSSVPDPRSTAYDVLGATHVVATTPLDQFTIGDRPLTLAGQAGQAWVYTRARALPVVRFVQHVEVENSAADALGRLHQPDFDPAQVAIVDRAVTCGRGDPAAVAAVVTRRPGLWEIDTRATDATLLVVAETAYPGWRVAIDGQEVESWPVVYGALRGVCVPAGEHRVEWTFTPVSHRIGALFSIFGLGLLAIALRKLIISNY